MCLYQCVVYLCICVVYDPISVKKMSIWCINRIQPARVKTESVYGKYTRAEVTATYVDVIEEMWH